MVGAIRVSSTFHARIRVPMPSGADSHGHYSENVSVGEFERGEIDVRITITESSRPNPSMIVDRLIRALSGLGQAIQKDMVFKTEDKFGPDFRITDWTQGHVSWNGLLCEEPEDKDKEEEEER